MIDFNFGVGLLALDSHYATAARRWRNEPEIMNWCRQSDVISDKAQERWFLNQEQDPSVKMYAIEADCFVGVCGFTSIDRISRRAEFSLYIAPEHQRRGLARKALKTLFTHGFINQNLNLIWGESFDQNPAISLFLELGMKQEGTRRDFYFKNGKFIDAHLFSMLYDEWRDQKW
jgi:ribosomal-protein-serine acetyltransferase